MRPILLLSCFWLCAGVLMAQEAGHSSAASSQRLALELSDGSRIFGTTAIDRFEITTDYASMEIPLSKLSSVEFSRGKPEARVSLKNGDLINARLAAREIMMQTMFGRVSIPLSDLHRIRVCGDGKAMPDGLVLHYTFDEDEDGKVTDTSGSGNDGTMHGAAYVKEGKVGSAMSFNGDQAGVMLKNSPSLELQDFTIMAWVKRADTERVSAHETIGSDGLVFSYGQGGYGLVMQSNNHIALSNIGIDNVSSSFEFHDEAFHHVAVTKSGTKVVFYLDGVAYPGPDYNTRFRFDSAPSVGLRADTMSNSWLGLMDEVAVFNRALSDDEVKEVYESQE